MPFRKKVVDPVLGCFDQQWRRVLTVTSNVGYERRLEASEACWKASARWKG